ncbi:diguanylate cyclase domain-containing protein [Pararhodospirillum photometricum]|uniref:Putative diguanylate cyclase (GGDEF domain) n=1 Tax=Pararhodospirillum photometricum DSM 122 TaxID=1150469 RepID=H6SPP0_PARPM|nr:diguanylate cyclase [Pararhodospirillum photometricum]CCG07160.1 Putative diguanylate cyclase (GGDEF domain) [Pararhodospirillum photometricum DSM 122]
MITEKTGKGMGFRTKSLRLQFSLVFAALIASFAVVMSVVVGQLAASRVEDALGFELSELAFHMGDKFDRGMSARMAELSVLTELETLRTPQDIPALQRLLDHLHTVLPVFTWVGFLDPEGKVLAASDGLLVGTNIAHRPVYTEGRRGAFMGDVHEAVLLAPYFPTASGEPPRFVDLGFPVYRTDGILAGVLASHLSFDWAREIERSLITNLQDRRRVDLFILGADGSPRLGPVGSPETVPAPLIATARQNLNGWAVTSWPKGEPALVGYGVERGHAAYPGMGWLFFARVPLTEAYAPVRALQGAILLVGFGLALAFALLGGVISRRIAQPLEAIADAADRLRAGLADQLPRVTGSSEILRLSASLRRLVEALTHSESRAGVLAEQATHDPLTGLPNRAGVSAYLTRIQPTVLAQGSALACLCLDLDGFKAVNDTLGHAAGDLLLQKVAQRLDLGVRAEDLAARLGGDEFLVLIQSPRQGWRDEAQGVAHRLLVALQEPFDIDGHTVQIGCSIGIAAWPVQSQEYLVVQELADDALYEAKHRGKHRAVVHGDPVPA